MRMIAVIALSTAMLLGCKTEVYQGLTEKQVNAMMTVLLKNGIQPQKQASKNGYALLVDSDRVALTLELMREHNLPRETHDTMGDVFSAQGMISSATEEKARMTYALSQELAETFSSIDGVLTSRVHVVMESQDLATGKMTPASAAVFLRHTPESQAPNLISRIQVLTANAVPGLTQDRVSVMLVPVRETITTPLLDARTQQSDINKFLILGSAALFVLSLPGLVFGWLGWRRRRADRSQGSQEQTNQLLQTKETDA